MRAFGLKTLVEKVPQTIGSGLGELRRLLSDYGTLLLRNRTSSWGTLG